MTVAELKRRGAACILLGGLACAHPAHAAVFHPASFTLGNGLQVVVVENHLAPVVTQMVWYKVGSADEEPGKDGLAHYLEHLMFRGTATLAPGAFSRTVALQGGEDNAFTSYDYTAYYEEVAADRLPLVMQMEADRMQNLQIAPDTATPELKVVLDERSQRTDNDPQGRFIEKLDDAFEPGDPYGRPVIGWRPDIEKLTAADAERFYRRHYAPNNAVVIVTGDVTPAEVLRLATGTFGRLPSHTVATRPKPTMPPLPTQNALTVTDAGVEQPEIVWRLLAPSYATQKHGEAYACEVLAEALSGEDVGLFDRDLMRGQGIASAVDVNYDPDARGPTGFTISASPASGHDAGELAEALHTTLARAAQDGLSADEIAAAKQRLQRSAIFAREGVTVPGYAFGMALTTGHTVADVEAWPDRINAVTAAQVNAALRRLAATPHQIVGTLLPDASATPAQAEAAQPLPSHGVGIR